MPKTHDDDLISISAAANAIGVNKSTLSRQIASGTIRSHAGKVRLEEVIADRAARLDPARVTRPATLRRTNATRNDDGATGLPAGMEMLASFDDPFKAGAAFGMLAMIYQAGIIAGAAALVAGGSVPTAYVAHKAAVLIALDKAEGLLGRDVPLDPSAIRECDWQTLAALHGLTFDRVACEAHLAAVNAAEDI